ncbi:MAG: exodeoxyribonuclease VII large subunit [Candidatus Omnitrophota bacterium]
MNWVTTSINGQEVSIAFDQNSIHIYNAFPIKDNLKSRGYRWNPMDKSWFMKPCNVDMEMDVLTNNLKSCSEPVSKTMSKPINSTEKAEIKGRAPYPDSLSVSELRNRLDQLIREGICGYVWVRGVIASDVKHYDWASYLDLKDEEENRNLFFRAEVKKAALERIEKKLSDLGVAQCLERDLPVFCQVEITLPNRNVVDIRLCLVDILPEYTQARIRNLRDITLEKLKEEGIIDNQKRLTVPPFISNVGLITSEQGTPILDIKAGLHPYETRYRFYFIDSRMEGVNAVDNIIRAITYFENNPGIPIDVLIIARGGGSEQSLAVFNDLTLCRKVCLCRIPIITAIGHEKDVSAFEQCSWLTPTPSTPSGVGKYLQHRYVSLQDQLSVSITRLNHLFLTMHHREMAKIKSFLKMIPAQVSNAMRWKEERFMASTRKLEQAIGFGVRDQERRLATLTGQILKTATAIHVKHTQGIRSMSDGILSRARLLRKREFSQVRKTMLKLDFRRLLRNTLKRWEDTRKNASILRDGAKKKIEDTGKTLNHSIQLVQAHDPITILKKGFTLTMNTADHRIIKSLDEFNQHDKALLRFYDGTIPIRKTNPKEELS